MMRHEIPCGSTFCDACEDVAEARKDAANHPSARDMDALSDRAADREEAFYDRMWG